MKRTIKALACVLLILSMVAVSVTAESGDVVSIEEYMIDLNGDVNADGVVDNLDAACILKYHAGIVDEFENKEAEATPLEGEHRAKVIADFLNYAQYFTEDDINALESVGVFGDCEVLWIHYNKEILDIIDYYDVGGYYVSYYKYTFTYVYRNGDFISLTTAYDNGYIDSDDVLEIVKVISGVYPTQYYEEDDFIDDYNPPEYFVYHKFGDVNCDRAVDNLDALWVLKYDAGLFEPVRPISCDFNAKCIKTSGGVDEETLYPRIAVIHSVDELTEYYNANKDYYCLDSEYEESIADYDEAYFENNVLLLIISELGSGSITQQVTGVSFKEENGVKELLVEFEVFIPEQMTDDIIKCHTVIELGKEYEVPVDAIEFSNTVVYEQTEQ